MRRRRWAAIDERAVLDERAGVDQIVDVLARRALAGLAPARDGIGPVLVEADGMALEHSARSGRIEVEIDVARRLVAIAARRRPRSSRPAGVPSNTASPADTRQRLHDAAGRGRDHVLHLHRFHDEQLLALRGRLAPTSTSIAMIGALQRRAAAATAAVGHGGRLRPALAAQRFGLAVREHRERIVGCRRARRPDPVAATVGRRANAARGRLQRRRASAATWSSTKRV